MLRMIAPYIPRFLTRLVYNFSYKVITLFFKGEKGQLWYRNSLYFDDLVFGLSDIDLTFLQEQRGDKGQVRRMEKKRRLIKLLIPHSGEINYYHSKYFSDFLPMANIYELRRDPVLLAHFKEKGVLNLIDTVEEECSKQVFVLNWIASDAHRMREYMPLRKKKMARFLSLLGESPSLVNSLFSIEDLLNVLIPLYFSSFDRNEIFSFLKDFTYFDSESVSSMNLFYQEYPQHHKFFMCFYPQKWLGASLHHLKFEDDLQSLSLVEPEFKDIFLRQIRWEVWGLFGQFMRSGDALNFHIHVENLLRAISVFGEDGEVEREGLRKLSRLQESTVLEGELYAS